MLISSMGLPGHLTPAGRSGRNKNCVVLCTFIHTVFDDCRSS